MARADELRLIARVAQMYHLEKRRQAEIAAALHLSQATVSRLLRRAVEEQIVRIRVVPPAGSHADLEAALRARFGLAEAVVVDAPDETETGLRTRIGAAAAHLIEATLAPGERIGISSWSETIFAMVEALHPLPARRAAQVVQLLGGLGDPGVQMQATQAVSRLADLTGAQARLLSAPGLAQSAEARAVIVADPYLRETMDLFATLSLAIIGIGALEPSRVLARSGNAVAGAGFARLAAAGAVGDIGLRFVDAAGRAVASDLDARVIGISLPELEQVERVMALAGGPAKTAAIAGALRSGVIDILVTDHFTARRLIAPPSQPAP